MFSKVTKSIYNRIICMYNYLKKGGLRMSEQEKKKKITLSVTEDTDKKISDLSKKYGMTKSGLVTILVQKANENGIFK